MAQSSLIFSWIFSLSLLHLIQRTSLLTDAKLFEYELPNRTVIICPTYSLISLECPHVPPLTDPHLWQPNLPRYLISIDYIRSYPSRISNDANACQPDYTHPCDNYDLRYINTLCNGKAQCPDIPTYQIRDRSLCAFKAVTEIGYRCVPTWYMNEVQTKCDICKNGSLTNDYGFIYSRNYPLTTPRSSCFTTIYARPNHKTILYFVNGQLNYDELRIESVTAEGLAILNVTLNGNLTTQRLGASTYETKITFTPNHIYGQHPTYFLLYFYTIPLCSITEPCPTPTTTTTTTTTTTYTTPSTTTTRGRAQSAGWTRVPNIWIVIPILLAYVLLLLLIIVLALFLQRRRKQLKRLENLQKLAFAARYVDNSGSSSRSQLVSPYPPSAPLPPAPETLSRNQTLRSRTYGSQTLYYPENSGYSSGQSADRYHRESRSDYNLHHNQMDYRAHPSSIYHRSHDTMDYPFYNGNFTRRAHQRRSLPKSFSDCDLCKRRVVDEEIQNYQSDHEHQDENWHWHNSLDQRERPVRQSRPYREKLKERVRERFTVRHIPNHDRFASLNHSPHQRGMSDSVRMTSSQTLPFEYVPNDSINRVRSVEYQRNGTNERVAVDNHHRNHPIDDNDNGATNFTVKFYQQDESNEDPRKDYLERSFHDAKEVQEMSMRMNEQIPYPSRHSHPYPQEQRRFNGNNAHL